MENTNIDLIEIRCADCGKILGSYTQEYLDNTFGDDNWFEAILGDHTITIKDGDFYCEDCRDRFQQCYECGEIIDINYDNYAYVQHRGYYCRSCTDTELTFCQHCEEYVMNYYATNTVTVSDSGRTETWCDECCENHAWTCNDCNWLISDEVLGENTYDGRDICPACADDYYTCEECGRLVHEDDVETHCGEFYCPDCYNEVDEDEEVDEIRPDSREVIYGYHDYPDDWEFRNEQLKDDAGYEKLCAVRNKVLHEGIELEIDDGGFNHENAIEITTALGFPANQSREFKCSRDGSLNSGFEIISMPASYDWHIRHYDWEAGMSRASELGYRSHDAGTCGLHFHLDRRYFIDSMTDPEEGFVIVTTNNINWFKKFSRRNNYGYCNFYFDNPFLVEHFKSDNNNHTQGRLDSLKTMYRGHSAALNFSNSATIELRFIRGTLKYSTFKAALQFVELLAYAVKHFRKEQLANVDLQWFKRFAEKRGYVEFMQYLNERGILG